MTSTECKNGWWREYFEDLLDSINMHSMGKAKPEDSEGVSFISGVGVTELVVSAVLQG